MFIAMNTYRSKKVINCKPAVNCSQPFVNGIGYDQDKYYSFS